MAEIKLNDSFAAQVNAFRASGGDLDKVSINSISSGDLSLKTVDAYHERLYKIRNVMIKFELLTKKDAADMDALASRLRAADQSGG